MRFTYPMINRTVLTVALCMAMGAQAVPFRGLDLSQMIASEDPTFIPDNPTSIPHDSLLAPTISRLVWSSIGKGKHFIWDSTGKHSVLVATIDETKTLTFGFRVVASHCSYMGTEWLKTKHATVNGVPIQMSAKCNGVGNAIVGPATRAGTVYLHQQFTHASVVTIDLLDFTTEGFSETLGTPKNPI